MAKTKDIETEKPAFDVSKTDKRNDKRVILDYVVASKFAPELLPLFDKYADDLDVVLATEGLGEVLTAVDTTIKQQVELITKRYDGVYTTNDEESEDFEPELIKAGDYSDYVLKGNGAEYFTEKAKRERKTSAEKMDDVVANADPAALAALVAALKARGLSLDGTDVGETAGE